MTTKNSASNGELNAGDKAPDFDLLGDDGTRHSLAAFRGIATA